ncbi:MAG: epoxyqueuosine reductase QueH [Lachnospiraceae bacterium]
MEHEIAKIKDGPVKKLLLHSCCAPCSSYVLETLTKIFEITVYYYNPNIYPAFEYHERAREQERFLSLYPAIHGFHYVEGSYRPEDFYQMAKGFESEPERGSRCYRCYEMRLRETARYAKEHGFDYFTTTLSISPMKNANWLNEIGVRLGNEYGVTYLVSDFKKKNGYLRSSELSREYGMYRQNYCGCEFSYRERKLHESEN